jgi:hypothetical protein
LLAAWLGAGILFAAVVAPAAFAALPSRTLAGGLVGRVLPVIFIAGIVISVIGMVFDRASVGRRPGVRRAALVVIAVSCAIGQFVVAPRIERIRRDIGGPIEALAITDARRVTFGRLHAISVGWLGLAMISAAATVVLASMAPAEFSITSRTEK